MKDYYKWAKEFAVEYIAPFAEEIDKTGKFPEEIFKKIAEEGFFKILVPKEFGGDGEEVTAHAQVTRAFSEACATVGLCYTMHNVALKFTLTFGREEIKNQVIKDVVENKKFMTLARSEFGTGVHVFNSQLEIKNTDEYSIITGAKSMITSANHASYYLISVPADKEKGPVNWLIPYGAEGLSFKESEWNGLGMRGNNSCPMYMENMKLDNKYAVYIDRKKANQIYPVNIDVIFFMTGLAAVYTGLSRTIYEAAKEHTLSRKYPGDKSLASIETVQLHLSQLFNNVFISESLLEVAAKSLENGEKDAFEKIMSARVTASLNCVDSATLAMRIGGGQAYNNKNSLARLLRDAFAAPVMFPSVDVLRNWIAKVITGQNIL
ncbi:acyl-CoA dehydrogenase [Leptotrichia sp. OH3620_COT-345]|uniref:acyl-CoA dehydrogenase family protein n=1 Tax=Leptotrichia sp. OH3620_COT-345 TaxID=2491048 RepID=UPI000F64E90E|nr:acyl-CoA dehydrogenase family protein [Leptotrichia sp. OH3620_COT-345]RRD39639.1 acyl-CoA dehydrogenase [Leptotrichia sp. OH3620_COT-345]